MTMQNDETLTFYTYAMKVELGPERWKDRAMPAIFFDDVAEARQKVLEVRDAMRADPEMKWEETYIEKIVTVPMTRSAVLGLLNRGVEAIIKDYEIIETIGEN